MTSVAHPAQRLAVPRPGAVVVGVAGWCVALVAGRLLGSRLYEEDPLVRIGAPPLVGSWVEFDASGLVPAVVLAAAAVWFAPLLAAGLPWRRLLVCAGLAALAWPVLLALGGGDGALTAPLESRYEYLAAVDRVGDPRAFLTGFTDALPSYPTHVKGHPPGLLLGLAGLDAIGLGGATVAAALVIGAGALIAPAALVAARELAGEDRARAAAPFVALAPAAIWIATSADALFAGVATVGIALFALASGRTGGRGDGLALAAGVVLGIGLLLTYGLAPLAVLVLAIAVWRRAGRALLVASLGVGLVLAATAAAGFWWFDGLTATRELYDAGVASRRPYGEFLVINLAALGFALGPAAIAGLAGLRDRALWVLCGAGIAAVAIANLSGLSRGETERIWLLFTPWLLLGAAGLAAAGPRVVRAALAVQLALALVVQATLRSPW